MARGHRLNTSIVLAAVHDLSGLFPTVSAVEPSPSRLLPTLSPSLIGHPASVDVKQHKSQSPPRPLSPSVPAVAGRQLVIVRAAAYASDSGESLHCFLVGANKSYVIATSDLWLFIHASNLLPSLPASLPYTHKRCKRTLF